MTPAQTGAGWPDAERRQVIARAIYEGRNGRGCKPWSRIGGVHQEPYLRDADVALSVMIAQHAAEVDAARRAALAVLTWADQKCPCSNEQPNPCPLCGASVENLEPCKAQDMTLPSHVLDAIRALARTPSAGGGTGHG